MRNTDKVELITMMSMEMDDFRDLIQELCGGTYDAENDYGDIRFIRLDEEGNEIDDYDENEVADYVTDKLTEYFDVITISGYHTLGGDYGTTDVMIAYIDN